MGLFGIGTSESSTSNTNESVNTDVSGGNSSNSISFNPMLNLGTNTGSVGSVMDTASSASGGGMTDSNSFSTDQTSSASASVATGEGSATNNSPTMGGAANGILENKPLLYGGAGIFVLMAFVAMQKK